MIEADPFNCVALRVVRSPQIDLVAAPFCRRRVAVVRSILFELMYVVLVPAILQARQLQVRAACNDFIRLYVNRVFGLNGIHVREAVPRIVDAADPTDPLPLCLYERDRVRPNLLARLLTRIRDFLPACASDELFQVVDQVTFIRVVFPGLASRATIVVKRSDARLFVTCLCFARPRNFLRSLFTCEEVIKVSTIAARCREADQGACGIRPSAEDRLGALLHLCLFTRRHFNDDNVGQPTFRFRLFIFVFFAHEFRNDEFFLFTRVVNVQASFNFPVCAQAYVFLYRFHAAASLLCPLGCVNFRLAVVEYVRIGPVMRNLPFFVYRFRAVVSFLRWLCGQACEDVVFVQVRRFCFNFKSLAMCGQVGVRVAFAGSNGLVGASSNRINRFAVTVITDCTNAVGCQLCFRVGDGKALSAFELHCNVEDGL